MEKYIIKFDREYDIDNFMWRVKKETSLWKNPPKVKRFDRTVQFGNGIIYLVTLDKQLVGRHDCVRISADSVFYAIQVMNEKLPVNIHGLL